MEEAEVEAWGLDGKFLDSDGTNPSGDYYLGVERAEKYILRVTAPGSKPVEVELTVPENAGEVVRDIEILPP